MDRRKAIKNLGMTFGAIAVTPSVIGMMKSCTTSPQDSFSPKFFSKKHLKNIREILDVMLPSTDDGIPGASQLRLVEFMDTYLYGVVVEEKLKKLRISIDALMNSAHNQLENTKDGLASVVWEAQLSKYLVPSPAAEKRWGKTLNAAGDDFSTLAKESPALHYFALQTLRGLAVFAFKINRTIGEEFLHYAPIPGEQRGCVSLSEATGGMLHAATED